MNNLLMLSKYPFLSASKKYVAENNLSVEELLNDPLYERARIRGVERLDNAFKNRDVGAHSFVTDTDLIIELISYPIARMIAVCIEDIYFKRRYALGEAVHAYRTLINEPTSFLVEIVKEFNLNVKYHQDSDRLSIYFVDYLRCAPTRYKEWKMINRDMERGYIRISHKDLARIIQETLRNRINEELDSKTCDKSIFKVFSSDITRIKSLVALHRKNIESAPIGKLDNKKLPPCMRNILSAVQAGENVPHMGRFALVSFLHSIKLNNKEILEIFSTAPDFEEEKTRYQVDHITGSISSTSYKPPGCDKMRTYGICPVEEIDDLCKKKKHPLSYYIEKWRQEKSSK